jgi:hypothetical protein
MENLCGNQNSPSTDILPGMKGVVKEDNVNTGEREECEQSGDYCNKIAGENTCEENLKEMPGVDGYETGNSIGNVATAEGAEDKMDDEKESSVLDEEVEKELLEEENTDLTENESSAEDMEKVDGEGDLDVAKSAGTVGDDKDDDASDTVEESKDAENFSASVDEQGTESVDQGLPGEGGSLNEDTVMDVEIANAEQEGCKEGKMNSESKDKETFTSDRPEKATEDDLEENLSQDDESSVNPSDCNANPVAEEEMCMNMSEEGEGEQSVDGEDQSVDQDVQVDNTEKNRGETVDVSMTNGDVRGGGNESIEIVSPADQDPISMVNVSEVDKDTHDGEQMEVSESTEESEKAADEMEDMTKSDELKDNSKQMEEADDSTKQSEVQENSTEQRQGSEDDGTEKEEERRHTEESDKPECMESAEDKQQSVENEDREPSSEKEKTVNEAEESGSGEATDEAESNVHVAPDDKAEMNSTADNKASGKDKADEELCIIPDTVLQASGKDGDKPDAKEVQQNGHMNSEKPAAAEVVEKPKPSRKSSSADKKGEALYTAAVEPVVEYRHSRPQRQAAKRAETQIKVSVKG